MKLQEVSDLQGEIENFTESLLDAKESLIDSKQIGSNILSDLNYKSQVLIGHLFKANINSGKDKTSITENEILEMICDASGYTKGEIKEGAKNRNRETLVPRQVHEVILYATFKKSLKEAGKVYGRDHATILHSLKAVNNSIDTDFDFREKYGYIFLLCNKINPNTSKKININNLSPQS